MHTIQFYAGISLEAAVLTQFQVTKLSAVLSDGTFDSRDVQVALRAYMPQIREYEALCDYIASGGSTFTPFDKTPWGKQ